MKIKLGDFGWYYNTETTLAYQYEGYLLAREMPGFPYSHKIIHNNPNSIKNARLKISVMASELFKELFNEIS